jgi:plastocyanin
VIRNFGFTGDLTVAPGATVKVVNRDGFVHTLTYKPHGVFRPGKFNTGNIPANGGRRTFVAPTKTGRYPFGCMHHLEMHGTLIVRRPPHPSVLTSLHQ